MGVLWGAELGRGGLGYKIRISVGPIGGLARCALPVGPLRWAGVATASGAHLLATLVFRVKNTCWPDLENPYTAMI